MKGLVSRWLSFINFKGGNTTGTDRLRTDHNTGANASAIGTTTAAIIGGALGATMASDVASGGSTALFTYNGDTFFIGKATGTDLDNVLRW